MTDDPPPSRRSRVAPLAPLALAAMAGVVTDRLLDPAGTMAWAVAAAVAATLAALAWRRAWLGPALIVASAWALAGGWHHHWWSEVAADDPAREAWAPGERRPCWVRGVVVDGATFRPGDDGPRDRGLTRTALALAGWNDGRGWRGASGRVQVSIAGDRSDLAIGTAVEAAGALSGLDGPLNPGEFDPRPFLRARGIRLRLAVDDPSGVWPDEAGPGWPWLRRLGAVRAWSLARLTSGLDPASVPLAASLLLGRREAVDPEVSDAFARTGTTHLLAISGLQLQVLAVFIGWSARSLGLGRKRSLLVVVVATVGYAILVGLAPSVVRSAAMTVGWCLAGLRDRCASAGNLMAGAVLATIAWNPSDLSDVGCQLSFLAVAAILWLLPAAKSWDAPELLPLDVLERQYEPRWRMLRRTGLAYVRDGARLSAIVWLAAWPLVALRFHLVSPIGILINLPLIPLTSLALLLAGVSLLLSAVWVPLGLPFGWASGVCLAWTEKVVRWATALPWGHAFVPGPGPGYVLGFYSLLGLATVALASRWPTARRWWPPMLAYGALGALLPLIPPHLEGPEARVLAVGHGLAVVVRSAEGRVVLYDAGKMADPHVGRRAIAPALWSMGLRRLDAVILSHADSDHYNALPDLLDRFEVGVLRIPPGFASAANPGAGRLIDEARRRGVPVEEIAEGDRVDLGGGMALSVLHPARGFAPGSTDNARSVVAEVASGGRRFLLTGDLEDQGLTTLTARPRPVPGYEAMLAPHHGGRTSNPSWLYDWARPGLVAVSQRSPASNTRDPLGPIAKDRFPLLRTWEAGAIRIRWEPAGLVATGFLDDRAPKPAPALASLAPAWSGAAAVVLGLIAGAASCFALIVVEWGAWSLVLPGRRLPSGSPEGRPIAATAPDGVVLAGSWFPAEHSEGRTILLLHGLAEDGSALLGRVPALNRLGWDVAVLDARAAGRSGGTRGTFGALESADLRAWLDALEPASAFVAWGRSMGAATAIRAASADPRLRALILEAPFADLRPTVAAVLRRLRIPGAFAPLLLLRARMLAGVSLDRPRPIDLAPKVAAPILILHGSGDPIAPIAEARRLAAAFPGEAEVIEVEGAGHANVVGIGGDTLMDRVGGFLDRVRGADRGEGGF